MPSRRTLVYSVGLTTWVLVTACRGSMGEQAPRATEPSFIGKAWTSTDPSAASGTLRVFLPDGTLVMTSCVETYRLARWRSLDEHRLEWHEESARIEAEVTQVGRDQLQLRLHLADGVKEEHFRLAPTPVVCPDVRPIGGTSAGPIQP